LDLSFFQKAKMIFLCKPGSLRESEIEIRN